MLFALLLLVFATAVPAWAHEALTVESLTVRWPRVLRQGDVGIIYVAGPFDAAMVEGSVAGRPLSFFPYGNVYAALVGIDLDVKPGTATWRVGVVDREQRPIKAAGKLRIRRRRFPVQRLTLPKEQVELDRLALKRVEQEAKHLRALYETITPERLWRGRFTKPVGISDSGEGFGARRIINDRPRARHAGLDYSADAGTPVVAANTGRVALVGDYFFPGRLVVIDHGLGLYTLYFHLERADVAPGDRVERGQLIGTVGSTGRVTGSHLHFAVHLGRARIDPAGLLQLTFPE